MTIKIAQSDKDKRKVFRLRYSIYVEEMQRSCYYADHESMEIIEPEDKQGTIFYAELQGEVIATIRLTIGSAISDYSIDFYELQPFMNFSPNKVAIAAKLMVEKKHRSSNILPNLFLELYRFCKSHNILFLFLDTNYNLMRLYQKTGFRMYTQIKHHHEYGTVVPLVTLIDDHKYLKKIDSWISRYSSMSPSNTTSVDFFNENFPSSNLPFFYCDSNTLFQVLEEKYNRAYHNLSKQFSSTQIKTFLQFFDFIEIKAQNYLINKIQPVQDLFILIHGELSYIQPPNHNYLIKEGDLIGCFNSSPNHKESAEIKCITNCHILVMNKKEFEKLEKIDAETSKLLTNSCNRIFQNKKIVPIVN